VTWTPFSFKAAAVEAIAVPQMPTKWTDRICENIGYIIEAGCGVKREKGSEGRPQTSCTELNRE
jgi:hypothetical protein